MVPFTNCKASMVMVYCNMYLLIENPFSGVLLPWDNDVAVLKSDTISGNFGNLSSSKIVLSRETISLSISSLGLASEITGRSAKWKAFSQYDHWCLLWFLWLLRGICYILRLWKYLHLINPPFVPYLIVHLFFWWARWENFR